LLQATMKRSDATGQLVVIRQVCFARARCFFTADERLCCRQVSWRHCVASVGKKKLPAVMDTPPPLALAAVNAFFLFRAGHGFGRHLVLWRSGAFVFIGAMPQLHV